MKIKLTYLNKNSAGFKEGDDECLVEFDDIASTVPNKHGAGTIITMKQGNYFKVEETLSQIEAKSKKK